MRRLEGTTIAGFAACCGLVWASAAYANDGVDRYQGPTCTELRAFDGPVSEAAGYRFLPRDFRGGADGDSAFRWARDVGVALVRLSARHVAQTLGAGPFPMAVFDLSSENGDTPVSFSDTVAPRGRHPGGSHDGGWNLDLGYYLTSLEGREFTPDFAACTDHFGSDDDHPDAYQCVGPADRLDVDRQALFLLEVVRVHHDDFNDDLIEEIGVDARIQEALLARLGQWVRSRRHRTTRALVNELERRMTADLYEGWARSHHHHLHLRLQRIDTMGALRPRVEALLQGEQELDQELAPGQGPALNARVRSCGLERSVAFSILRSEEVQRCEYRVGNGAWRGAASSERGFRHVEEIASRPGRSERTVTVDARVTLRSGTQQVLRQQLVLPRQDPELWIAVRPERIEIRAVRLSNEAVHLSVDLPLAYRRYVTRVRYVLDPSQGQPILGESSTPSNTTRSYPVRMALPSARREIVLARAYLQLSGRLEIMVPFVIPTRSVEPTLWD